LYDSHVRPRCTGKERDSETGLDWFDTRYFSGAQGRFTSPDQPFNDQESSDPQSWNLYSYVRNNPLKFIDPSGRDCVYLNGSGTGVGSIDNQTNAGHCGNNGGYWVEGTVTGAQIGTNSVSLTGTTNGTNVTTAFYDIAPDPGLMALKEAGNRASRDLSTIAIIMGGTAAAIATVSVAPLAYAALPVGSEAGVLVLGGKAIELARNAAGKIKGNIEDVRAAVYRMSPEQLKQAADELRQSIQVRSQELLQKGEEAAHRLRIDQERDLLRTIEKKLGGN
jgi:RHS repeat-associated protein